MLEGAEYQLDWLCDKWSSITKSPGVEYPTHYKKKESWLDWAHLV